MSSRPVIGVDFDNTIVSYDDLMFEIALEKGYITVDHPKTKKSIRDTIRLLSYGEMKWQKLQGAVYGPEMSRAVVADGVISFFEQCRRQEIKVHIISHKTQFANYDPTATNLREAAMRWIEEQGLFKSIETGLSSRDVYFESSRSEKIQRINMLNCTHFIDDLEETFLEDSFPSRVSKILYDPHREHAQVPQVGAKVANHWKEIEEIFFHDCL